MLTRLLLGLALLCVATTAQAQSFGTSDLARNQAAVSIAGTGPNGQTSILVPLFSPAPSSSAGSAIASTQGAAVASSLVAKASAGNLYDWQVTSGASAGYVLIFNATSAPADGAVTPVQCVVVAANSTVGSSTITLPERFSTGITLVFSTTGCFSKTASATAFIRARVQ